MIIAMGHHVMILIPPQGLWRISSYIFPKIRIGIVYVDVFPWPFDKMILAKHDHLWRHVVGSFVRATDEICTLSDCMSGQIFHSAGSTGVDVELVFLVNKHCKSVKRLIIL